MFDKKTFDMPHDTDMAWCPGCGNFPLITILKMALAELDIAPETLVTVSGIEQAAKAPHYFRTHVFNGLHGRALPAATGIKAANPALHVVVESGDGDMYGEGGNHFVHTIRRNPGITAIVHNNMVYGLTKGQASPTSARGMVTPIQTVGVTLEPFHPIATAVALDVSFAARAFAGDVLHAKEVFKRALAWKGGFALVDVFQPCVVYNKVNTYQWFKEHTYKLDENYDPTDRKKAFAKAIEDEQFPLGVIYENPHKKTFEEQLFTNGEALYKKKLNEMAFEALLTSKR
jgi:2-oxoglutarate ferredoxin oxidoreductase subunit beta